MKEIKLRIFTSLDSLFDTKLVVLKRIITEDKITDFIENTYKSLRLFNFDLPKYEITNDMYFKEWEKRDNKVLAEAELTNLRIRLANIAASTFKYREFDEKVGIPDMTLTVNIYPYQLDEKLMGMVRGLILDRQVFPCSVEFVNVPGEKLGISEYSYYDIVIDQNLYLDKKQSRTFSLNLTNVCSQDTNYIIPRVALKNLENGEFLDPTYSIYIIGLLMGPRVRSYEGEDFETFIDETIELPPIEGDPI